jgi:hypothetical protein
VLEVVRFLRRTSWRSAASGGTVHAGDHDLGAMVRVR